MSWISSTILDTSDYLNTIIGQGTDYASILSDLGNRLIGRSIYYRNIPNKDMALIKNPYKRRYSEYPEFFTKDKIGERVNVYENMGRQITFLDDVGGLEGFINGGYKENENVKVVNNFESVIKNVKQSTNKKYDYQSLNKTQQTPKINIINVYNEGGSLTLKGGEVSSFDNIQDISKSDVDVIENSLIYKTNELFKQGKINSIISRFCDKNDVSRGRNLRKEKPTSHNGYNNPYCRVWTSHHQYAKYEDTIKHRHNGNIGEIQVKYGNLRPNDGAKRLNNNSVLDYSTGMVRYSPTKDNPDITKCMFSIENLAWKDSRELPDKQKGPNGGRIMWFPPYNLEFTENVSANYNANTFIGRGEKIYTYVDTERTGTLNFTLLVDHPSTLNQWRRAIGAEPNDKQDKEEEVLRFFAGCQDLKYNIMEIKESDKVIEASYKTASITEIKQPFTYRLMVFFPNNFSGNDRYNENNKDSENVIIGICKDKYENTPIGVIDDGGYYYPCDSDLFTDMSESIDTFSYALNQEKGINIYEDKIRETYNLYDDSILVSIGNIYNGSDISINNIKDLLLEHELNVKITGFASSLGGSDNTNLTLARRRMYILKDFIEKNYGVEVEFDDTYDGFNIINVDEGDDEENISSLSAKIGRCAMATFEFTPKSNIAPLNNIETDTIINEVSENYDKFAKLEKMRNEATIITVVPNEGDYYDEYMYFSELKSSDNLLYKTIVDKVKYFNPAYHSMTPEGFNARLTFLHQCTRQGPTTSASDKENGSSYGAGNLAFGRAPYCVLRIGDFYHTKICIDAISISYENSTWDMNPEGIGVQPMLAKISMNFKFIGGSDLKGPINQLQNAASANYYANTSIYDDNSKISGNDKLTNSEKKMYDANANKMKDDVNKTTDGFKNFTNNLLK